MFVDVSDVLMSIDVFDMSYYWLFILLVVVDREKENTERTSRVL